MYALCVVSLAGQSSAYLLPAQLAVIGRGRGSLGLGQGLMTRINGSRKPISRSTLRASGQKDTKSKAEVLADELKTDLTQMFDLSYEPKWDLYADGDAFEISRIIPVHSEHTMQHAVGILTRAVLYVFSFLQDVLFTDPLNKFTGIQKYKDNIKMLKDSPLFTNGKMDLHEVTVVDETCVDTRWTLEMTFKPFPWKPVIFCSSALKWKLAG